VTDHAEIITHLKGFDTPSIANALNSLRGRTIEGYMRPPFVAARPKAPPMVGYAFTAKLVSDKPSALSAAEQKALRSAYYRYIGGNKRPGIVVIEDHGELPGLGSFWGDVNTAIHLGLGLSGVITSGAVRDLDQLSDDLPILAGCVCLNNGFTNLTAIDVPVSVFGMTIKPGDLIHADQHGAILIPPDCVAGLPDAIKALVEREHKVIAATRQPGFDAEAMIKAWEAMETHH
jgi:regulator of RNase E activity RraA